MVEFVLSGVALPFFCPVLTTSLSLCVFVVGLPFFSFSPLGAPFHAVHPHRPCLFFPHNIPSVLGKTPSLFFAVASESFAVFYSLVCLFRVFRPHVFIGVLTYFLPPCKPLLFFFAHPDSCSRVLFCFFFLLARSLVPLVRKPPFLMTSSIFLCASFGKVDRCFPPHFFFCVFPRFFFPLFSVWSMPRFMVGKFNIPCV